MDKKYYIAIGILVVLLLVFIVPKYFVGNVTASGVKISGDIEKIEVIHFHTTSQCSSCTAVGRLAEETINTYFAKELESGKITFESINVEWPKNFEKVKKYGVKGSSLLIGTYYTDGSFEKEENINVWYKINNKQNYMTYLKDVIDNKFSNK